MLGDMVWGNWGFVNATTVRTPTGNISLITTAPKRVKELFEASVTREVEASATQKIRQRLQLCEGEGGEPWWDLIQKEMRGKRLGPLEKSIWAQILGGTYICNLQLAHWGTMSPTSASATGS